MTLKDLSGKETTSQTGFFGDFAFNNVAMGKHSIRCEAKGYLRYTQNLEISKEIEYLGEIALKKKK